MNYYIKEINSCESRINDKIDIIKKYGIDVSKYNDELREILSNYEDFETDSYNAGVAMQSEMQNMGVLKGLNSLEEKLDNYQIYLKVYFRNTALTNELENNCDFNKINMYVDESKSILNDTFNINCTSVNEAKKMIKDVYNTVYKVIRLELVNKGNSDLLDYIVDSNLGVEYLNDIIREEITSLEKDNISLDSIDEVLDDLYKDGVNYNLADPKLILSIIMKNDKELVKDKIDTTSEKYDKKISNVYDRICDYDRKLSDFKDNVRSNEKKLKGNRMKAIFGAIILAMNIITIKAFPSALRKNNTDVKYMTTREVYDTVSDDVRRENVITHKKESEYAEVVVYGEVGENGYRDIKSYDLSDKEIDDIKDYVDFVDEKTSTVSSKSEKYRMSSQLSREEYMVVERMVYGESYEEFDEEQYEKDLRFANKILYGLGLVNSINLVAYVVMLINNKRRIRKDVEDVQLLETNKRHDKEQIEMYREIKEELLSIKEKCENEELEVDEYIKKMHLKSRKN